MSEKITVVALGHRALGTTLPEQKIATKKAAKAVADLVEAGNRVVISHSNGPQVGMIHTAMNEFGKTHPDYTFAPMSVCSAMSQGYIGYDLQTAIRASSIFVVEISRKIVSLFLISLNALAAIVLFLSRLNWRLSTTSLFSG